jgi:hypothetical protein
MPLAGTAIGRSMNSAAGQIAPRATAEHASDAVSQPFHLSEATTIFTRHTFRHHVAAGKAGCGALFFWGLMGWSLDLKFDQRRKIPTHRC